VAIKVEDTSYHILKGILSTTKKNTKKRNIFYEQLRFAQRNTISATKTKACHYKLVNDPVHQPQPYSLR